MNICTIDHELSIVTHDLSIIEHHSQVITDVRPLASSIGSFKVGNQ